MHIILNIDMAGLGPLVDPVYRKTMSPKDRALYAILANNFKITELVEDGDTLVVQANHGGSPSACARWANDHFYLDGKCRVTIATE